MNKGSRINTNIILYIKMTLKTNGKTTDIGWPVQRVGNFVLEMPTIIKIRFFKNPRANILS